MCHWLKLLAHWCLQKCWAAFCWSTCSCSARSSNWHGCSSTVSHGPVWIIILSWQSKFPSFMLFETINSTIPVKFCFSSLYNPLCSNTLLFLLQVYWLSSKSTFLAHTNYFLSPGMKLNCSKQLLSRFRTRTMMLLIKWVSLCWIFRAVCPTLVCWFFECPGYLNL